MKVARDAPLDLLGPLGCGVITGAGAIVNSMQVGIGKSLAVFGTGAVGLSAVMAISNLISKRDTPTPPEIPWSAKARVSYLTGRGRASSNCGG